MEPSTMLLQEFIEAPSKAESILDKLTTEQLQLIETTLRNVKKRKLDKEVTPPSPPSESEEVTAMDVDPIVNNNNNPTTTLKVNNHHHPIIQNTMVSTTTTTTTPSINPNPNPATTSVAAAIATALAAAMTNAVANTLKQQQQQNQNQQQNQQQQQLNINNNNSNNNNQLISNSSNTNDQLKQQQQKIKSPVEPMAEVKDGVEWVSFVYSHNRVMKKYTIRTDLENIGLDQIDDKFKADNCVYPRANLPKDQYKGNRWAYETECNVLGWKLAWLNMSEISGKRGLIQRAVDSYRNRYPSMRSRRVARQAKLMNGTLRKRKQRGDEEDALIELVSSLTNSSSSSSPSSSNTAINPSTMSSSLPLRHHPDQLQCSYVPPTSLDTATIKPSNHPKTIAMEDLATGTRCRIKINVETVSLDYIPHDFRLVNSPYPRYLRSNIPTNNRPRAIEETICNELAWKLAWLNPKTLAGKKNMLQRAIDLYRSKFMPSMPPRKHSSRQPILATLLNNPLFQQLAATSTSLTATSNNNNNNTVTSNPIHVNNTSTNNSNVTTTNPINSISTSLSTTSSPSSTSPIVTTLPTSASSSSTTTTAIPLTASALSAQNAQFKKMEEEEGNITTSSPTMSCISGTTATLDFTDCLSLADENCLTSSSPLTSSTDLIQQQNNNNNTTDIMFSSCSPLLSSCFDEASTTISSSSSGTNSVVCTPSPPVSSDLFNLAMDEMYDALMLPPTVINDSYMSDNTNNNNNSTMPLLSSTSSSPLLTSSLSSLKNYDSLLSSPSLPSSTLQPDLLIKLENVDNFADQLLEPFF